MHDGAATLTGGNPSAWPSAASPMGALEILGGTAACAAALFMISRSSLGAFVVGALSTVIGLPFILMPGVTKSILGPTVDRLQAHSDLGKALSTYVMTTASRAASSSWACSRSWSPSSVTWRVVRGSARRTRAAARVTEPDTTPTPSGADEAGAPAARRMQTLADAAWDAVPIVVGYVTLGLAAGMLLVAEGLAWWWAPVWSLVIYSGTMQMLLVPLAGGGEPLAAIALSTGFVSGRHVFYGLGFPLERVRGRALTRLYAVHAITDEVYALLAARDRRANERALPGGCGGDQPRLLGVGHDRRGTGRYRPGLRGG